MMKQALIAYSFSHFVVDFLCAFTIFSIPNFFPELTEQMLLYIIIYGMLAFGLQVLFGAIGDSIKKPKLFALLGISLNFVALFLLFLSPLAATIITGVGNALFHVGGGMISLHLGKRKATLPGIFVSTGAMGVFLGTFLPVYTSFSLRYLVGLALLTFFFLLITKIPPLQQEKAETLPSQHSSIQYWIVLICFFILLSIFIRSVIGFLVPFPRKSGFLLGFLFTGGVMLGKALGGILADKFGLAWVGISSLTLSAILLGFFSSSPWGGMIGIFLFNMTMPITLVILANTLKGREGFAFGLTTLALILGAMPYYTGFSLAKTWIFCSIMISVIAIGSGLYFYRKLFTS